MKITSYQCDFCGQTKKFIYDLKIDGLTTKEEHFIHNNKSLCKECLDDIVERSEYVLEKRKAGALKHEPTKLEIFEMLDYAMLKATGSNISHENYFHCDLMLKPFINTVSVVFEQDDRMMTKGKVRIITDKDFSNREIDFGQVWMNLNGKTYEFNRPNVEEKDK